MAAHADLADITAPTISFSKTIPVALEAGATYMQAMLGVSASDTYDGSVLVTCGTPNMFQLGLQTVCPHLFVLMI